MARRLLLEQRLVVNATGPDTIRLLPPLTVSDGEIDEALSRIGRRSSEAVVCRNAELDVSTWPEPDAHQVAPAGGWRNDAASCGRGARTPGHEHPTSGPSWPTVLA